MTKRTSDSLGNTIQGTSVRSGRSAESWIAGGALLAFALLLSTLSRALDSNHITRERALTWLACGGVLAGFLYLLGLYRARRSRTTLSLIRIVVVAALSKTIVFASPPMLESDYQRYLWDGAVTAAGLSPYRFSPNDIMNADAHTHEKHRVSVLARDADTVLSSINHPHLATIYPPVAQAGFAIAYAIAPFDPNGLRIVFLVADAATILLLARLLNELRLPASYVAWFAWNPLLLREVYSSLHMDILLLPLVVAALLAAVRSRSGLASAWLVIASAVKVWPIVLVPLVVRPLAPHWRRLGLVLGMCGLLGALLWAPVMLVPHRENSGFLAYGRGWQNNDGFFRAGIWVIERVLDAVKVEPWHSHTIMRFIAAGLIAGIAALQLRSRTQDATSLMRRGEFLVSAIFLLSPTQFPWYWLWCLPFLTIRPTLPLLLYTALLPIYYVQEQLAYPLGHWLQHAPVWGLLLVAGWRAWRERRRLAVTSQEFGRA